MIDLDDFYGPMEVDGNLSITLGTETRTERDILSRRPYILFLRLQCPWSAREPLAM